MAPRSSAPPGTIAALTAEVMKHLSRLRGKRIVHPHGVAFAASLTPVRAEDPGVSVLEHESEAVVRLSRSAGLPEWLPDPCGLALRIPDAYGARRHQDLLMISSSIRPVARHAILPARGFFDRPYSSLLPYRLRGELVVVAARPAGQGPGPKLAELADRDSAGVAFELGIATLAGPWRPLARLTVQERIADEDAERLDFDPTNTGGGLELAGALNRLRGPGYRASQRGRGLSGSKSAGRERRSPQLVQR